MLEDDPSPGGSVAWRGSGLRLPRMFGSYELLREVARGGMGIVYQARQIPLNRLVAVKVMVAGPFAAPDFVERFCTEAEAAARLDHPNIVPIHEIGECEGQPFFSMRFVEGGSLAHWMEREEAGKGAEGSRFDFRAIATLLARIAHAVHYAHQRGLLHRDIKPGNILLDLHGEPLLTDFGLAKLVEKDSTLTRTAAMLGTPSYMSPEQARGEAKQLTTAVDVYGLGAVLYQLLTGQPPFAGGTTLETVRQVLEKEPRRPSTLRPGLDRDLETICLKSLSKEPSSRYGSAEALALDLERWLRCEPILARPVSTLERIGKWMRRRPLPAALIGLTLLATAASIVTLSWANVHIGAARNNEVDLRERAETKAEESRQRLVRLNVRTGSQLVEEGDPFGALRWFVEALALDQQDPVSADIHRRRIGAMLRGSPRLAHLWFHDGAVRSVDISPDGEQIVSASWDRTARVWDLRTGAPAAPPLRQATALEGAIFTRDGRRVITIDEAGRARFWDARTGQPIGPALPTSALWAAFDLSQDGRWFLAAVTNGVQLFSATNGAALGPLIPLAYRIDLLRFSPDGRSALVGGKGGDAMLLEMPSGRVKLKLPSTDRLRGVDFRADGRHLATIGLRDLRVWDVDTSALVFPEMRPGGDLFDPKFSPDGRRLAIPSWDGFARVVDAESGLPVGLPMRHRNGVIQAVFNVDGRWLATASRDGTARVWNAETGEPASPSLPQAGYLYSVRFTSDGAHVVTSSQDHSVRLWELRTNSAARLVLRHPRGVTTAQFSPDGRHLLTADIDGQTRVRDAQTGEAVAGLSQEGMVVRAGFSRDGLRIVTATANGAAGVWDFRQSAGLAVAVRHAGAIRAVEFSPDGGRFLTAGDDNRARVWNAGDGRAVTPWMTHKQGITHAAFDFEGLRIVTASLDKTAQVWDASTGATLGAPMKHACGVSYATFSPDGRRVVTAASDLTELPRSAQVWDAATGQPLGPPMRHRDGVTCAEFSPDGRRIATAGEDYDAMIWDSLTGQLLVAPLPHHDTVMRVRFSPNGRLLLTVSSDRTARVWDVATGEPVTPPLPHDDAVRDGSWSPDGNQVATGSSDGTARVWDVSPAGPAVAELRRQAEVLSAHRTGPNLGAVPLTAKEMAARWETLKELPTDRP